MVASFQQFTFLTTGETSMDPVTHDDSETAKFLSEGMSYGSFIDMTQGISCSLSADRMLFGLGKSERDRLAEVVKKLEANEAKIKGVSTQEVFSLPSETMMDPSTVKMFFDALNALDKKARG